MHDTALRIGELFFESYVLSDEAVVLDVGAFDVNGSLRSLMKPGYSYIGLDITEGPGVDIVGTGHALPFKTSSIDAVVSTSVFEHDSMFWLTFLEMARVAVRGGYIYINAPSNGPVHRFPADNWRFYPDAGHALCAWARLNGLTVSLVESFIARRSADIWNDFVAVFILGELPRGGSFISDKMAVDVVWRSDGRMDDGRFYEVEDRLLLRKSLRGDA